MRTLIVGALAATLVGCSCFVSPQSGVEACTGVDGHGFACFDRNVAVSRLSQATEPTPDPGTAASKEKTVLAARTAKPSSAHGGKTRHAGKAEKSTIAAASKAEPVTTARAEPTAAAPQPDAIDPVIDRAKMAVAVKLGNPASAAFGEMKRSMRKNALGQSIDTICGHVKSSKGSDEAIGDRAFLYLVKEDEAYVADDSPVSAASIAYRNICN
jgi:hypothetical protein